MPEGATLSADATHAMQDKSCPHFCAISVSMSPMVYNSTPQPSLGCQAVTACCHGFIIKHTITLAVIFHVGDSH